MRLFIAEKPSMGMEIAKVLSNDELSIQVRHFF